MSVAESEACYATEMPIDCSIRIERPSVEFDDVVSVEHRPFSQPWEESDVVLIVEEEKFHVHRLVLTLNSPVFKAMLKSDFKEAKRGEITLPEKDAHEVLDLLKQLYMHERDEISSQPACMQTHIYQ